MRKRVMIVLVLCMTTLAFGCGNPPVQDDQQQKQSQQQVENTAVETTLGAGEWYVGEDIPPGRYVITPPEDQSGNIGVYEKDEDYISKSEILNPFGTNGVKSVTYDLKEGQKIEIRSMDAVLFTPKGAATESKNEDAKISEGEDENVATLGDANPKKAQENSLEPQIKQYMDSLNDLHDLRMSSLREYFKIVYKAYLEERDQDSSDIELNPAVVQQYYDAYTTIDSDLELVKQLNSKRAGTESQTDYKEYMHLRKEIRELFRSYGYGYPYELGELVEEDGLEIKVSSYSYYGNIMENDGMAAVVLLPVEVTNTTKKDVLFSFSSMYMTDTGDYTCKLYDIIGEDVGTVGAYQTVKADLLFECREAPAIISIPIGADTYRITLLP